MNLDQFSEPALQLSQANIVDLERQPKVGSDLFGLVRQAGVRHLAQVEQRLVIAEEHLLQLWMAVEAEAAHDCALKVADEPVGEEERRRALLADALEKVRACQHLVAMRAAHA